MIKIEVNVVKAILTRYTEVGSEMDPYATVSLGGLTQKTTIQQEKGDMPEWNETLTFFPNQKDCTSKQFDELTVVVKDSDVATDDIIGQVSISVSQEVKQGLTKPKWYSLKYNKKPAGKIMLEIKQQTDYVQTLGYGSQKVNQFVQNGANSQNRMRGSGSVDNYNRNSQSWLSHSGHKQPGIRHIQPFKGFSHIKPIENSRKTQSRLEVVSKTQGSSFYTGKRGVSHSNKYNHSYDPIGAERKAYFGNELNSQIPEVQKMSGLSSISRIRKKNIGATDDLKREEYRP